MKNCRQYQREGPLMSRIMKNLLMIALVTIGLGVGTSHVAAGYGKKCTRKKTTACNKSKKPESKKPACKCKGKCACTSPSIVEQARAWIRQVTGLNV